LPTLEAVVVIFCNYKEKDTQSTENLLASVLMQLVYQTDLPQELLDLYNENVEKGTRPGLSEISGVLRKELQRHGTVFVIIDALDECDESTIKRVLRELCKGQSNVNVMVTSRQVTPNTDLFFESRILQIVPTAEDTRLYIERRFADEPSIQRQIGRDAAFRRQIVDLIVERSQGM